MSFSTSGEAWPLATTPRSSRASRASDSTASGQLQVEVQGGGNSPRLRRERSNGELTLIVNIASPQSRTRSERRKNAECPGVWPGVGTHSLPAGPQAGRGIEGDAHVLQGVPFPHRLQPGLRDEVKDRGDHPTVQRGAYSAS